MRSTLDEREPGSLVKYYNLDFPAVSLLYLNRQVGVMAKSGAISIWPFKLSFICGH
jgi:hypothetical protein